MPDAKFSDVIVVGAGLSGIASAYHILKKNPGIDLKILEGRGDVGGTWDLFRYPGLRSDSDMHTYGFSFNRWSSDVALASGSEIKEYIKGTWKKFSLNDRTEFGVRVVRADWSSEQALWTLTVRKDMGSDREYQTRFLMMSTGYYEYEKGYSPDFDGAESFNGEIVHPQAWLPDTKVYGKKIVVIGSGATAVTLVPTFSLTADHVTMLQRSPTYMIHRPRVDGVATVNSNIKLTPLAPRTAT